MKIKIIFNKKLRESSNGFGYLIVDDYLIPDECLSETFVANNYIILAEGYFGNRFFDTEFYIFSSSKNPIALLLPVKLIKEIYLGNDLIFSNNRKSFQKNKTRSI